MGKVEFLKMHALGNDFVMFDGVSRALNLDSAMARRIADRRTGIGCDQILLLERPRGAADFRYRIWNADGGEVAQCGNGARCIPHFVRRRGLSPAAGETGSSSLRLETANGEIRVETEFEGSARAYLAVPEFGGDALMPGDSPALEVELGGKNLPYDAVFLGNPHAVFMAEAFGGMDKEEFHRFDLAGLARAVRAQRPFPEGVNVGLCRQRDDKGIADLRVDERGAGETPSCGSGAAAAGALLLGRRRGWKPPVRIELAGGQLKVGWDGTGLPVWIEGPVSESFSGEIDMQVTR